MRDAHQIEVDVARALWRYPAGIRMPQRLALRKRLAALIHAVLGHHPELQCVARGARRRRRHARSLACGGSYYQGFHDVCAVVMLNLDDTSAFVVASQLALVHLRDYMRPDMTTTLAYLELLAALLAQVEPEIHDLMERSAVGGHFALSWLLTLFAHECEDLPVLSRILDAVLGSPPLFPLYMAAALVRVHRDRALGVECE